MQLLLDSFPEGKPVWSRDRAAGLPLRVVLRRRVHRETSFMMDRCCLESTTLARVLHNVKGRESVLDIPMALPEVGILVGFPWQKYNQFFELCHNRQPYTNQGGLPAAQSVRQNGH